MTREDLLIPPQPSSGDRVRVGSTIQAGTTFRPGLGAQVWVSDARGSTASLVEFPEGVGCTDVWTIPGEEAFADVYRVGKTFDLPLNKIHEHLVPYHAMQIEDFIDALRNGREPAVTGREAIKSLEIIQAIYESARTGATVELTRAYSSPSRSGPGPFRRLN